MARMGAPIVTSGRSHPRLIGSLAISKRFVHKKKRVCDLPCWSMTQFREVALQMSNVAFASVHCKVLQPHIFVSLLQPSRQSWRLIYPFSGFAQIPKSKVKILAAPPQSRARDPELTKKKNYVPLWKIEYTLVLHATVNIDSNIQ